MLRIDRLTHIGRIDCVDVYVHWTVFVLIVVMLLGVVRQPLPTIIGIGCWLGVMLLHECGHMFVAKRRHSQVYSIELYPISHSPDLKPPGRVSTILSSLGEACWRRRSWLFQLRFGSNFFGYTPFSLANEALVICGPVSLAIAAFNLLPFKPLDGAMAWQIFAAAFERGRFRNKQKTSGWRSYR